MLKADAPGADGLIYAQAISGQGLNLLQMTPGILIRHAILQTLKLKNNFEF